MATTEQNEKSVAVSCDDAHTAAEILQLCGLRKSARLYRRQNRCFTAWDYQSAASVVALTCRLLVVVCTCWLVACPLSVVRSRLPLFDDCAQVMNNSSVSRLFATTNDKYNNCIQ